MAHHSRLHFTGPAMGGFKRIIPRQGPRAGTKKKRRETNTSGTTVLASTKNSPRNKGSFSPPSIVLTPEINERNENHHDFVVMDSDKFAAKDPEVSAASKR